MLICPQCSLPVSGDERFCRSCGLNFNERVPVVADPAYAFHPQTSGKAIASFVCGITGFLFFLPSIPAIILGHISRSQIRKSAGRLAGEGMAMAGLVMGYIVVAGLPFFLIFAAIAIPNLLRARIAANEAAAVGCLRTITTAAKTYSVTFNGFPPTLAALGQAKPGATPDATAAGLIDDLLVSGVKFGYRFVYQVTGKDEQGHPTSYSVQAEPVTPGTTGINHYYADESGVIRVENSGPATKDSRPLSE